MTIGQRVLDLLNKQGKKQNALAEYCGIGVSTVSQWKSPNRNPSSELLIPICEFLGVSVHYLLTGGEGDDSPQEDLDRDLLSWLHKLDKKTQRDFLGQLRLYVNMHPEDRADLPDLKVANSKR